MMRTPNQGPVPSVPRDLLSHVHKGKGRKSSAWKRPPQGAAKIKVDAGLNADMNTCGATAICRNDQGEFLGSSVLVIQGIRDPGIAEAITWCEVVALAEDL